MKAPIKMYQTRKARHASLAMFLLIAGLLLFTHPFVKAGDTLKYTAHQQTQLEWFGNYDKWAVLPDDTADMREVRLHYTLECGPDGCGYNAHTTRIQALKPTGNYDTVIRAQPNFKVNGYVLDTFPFSYEPTYQYYFDSGSLQTDSLRFDSFEVVRYSDTTNPMIPTDTMFVWPAGYHHPVYDSTGNVIRQEFVAPDTVWTLDYHTYHDVAELFKQYELARVQTPFGGFMDSGMMGFDSAWSHTYEFDVSDFSGILRDSVVIRVRNEGWQSGYSSSVNLEYVKGRPNKQVTSVRTLYQGTGEYLDQTHFDTLINRRNFQIAEETDAAKLRFIISGHGRMNNQQCGAFCKKRYFVSIDQQQVFEKAIWRDDCGMNPIFPQAGDWVENRPNWCPGMRTKKHEYLLDERLFDGREHSLDLDFEPIEWEGDQAPYYHITAQLITYDSLHENDVAVEDILAPSKKDEFARMNPVAISPEIRIKNEGTEALKSLQIRYGMDEEAMQTHQWTGTLPPMETQKIKLPAQPDWRDSGNLFRVQLENPNGATDEYKANNEAISRFPKPDKLPQAFVLNFQSNVKGGENDIKILNAKGEVQYENGAFEPNALLTDTVNLFDKGKRFRLVVSDEGGDGLYYPFNNAGKGMVSLSAVNDTSVLKTFPANFGDGLVYEFTTVPDSNMTVDEEPPDKALNLYPNPARDHVRVDVRDFSGKQVEVQLINSVGAQVWKKAYRNPGDSLRLDLGNREPGVYIVKLRAEGQWFAEKLLIR